MIRFDMKSHFFDRPVVQAFKNAGRAILGKFGAYTRRTARQSIKPARRKTEAELSEEEREQLAGRMRAWAAGRLAKKPEPPYRTSAPGDPPFAHAAQSPIRLILFAYDPEDDSVTVGPVAYGRRPGDATDALEHGGRSRNYAGETVTVRARPTMTPAFKKNLPLLRKWRNAL